MTVELLAAPLAMLILLAAILTIAPDPERALHHQSEPTPRRRARRRKSRT